MRIEKNPGLGFSISGGISGQGNPFKPSDMVRPEPGLPANHSLPGFTSELPWKLLLVTAVVRLSVRMSVCLPGSS